MSVSTIASTDSVVPETVKCCIHAVIVQTAGLKTHPFRSSLLSLFARDQIHPYKHHNGHPEIASTSADSEIFAGGIKLRKIVDPHDDHHNPVDHPPLRSAIPEHRKPGSGTRERVKH